MMTTKRQHRMSSVLTRIATAFSTFIVAVILSTHYKPLGPNINPERDSFQVVIAKTEIPVGSRIIAEQLAITQLPRRASPDGTFPNIDENLVGRVAVVGIAAREPVTESRLAPIGSAAGLWVIPEGYRAMTVKVDDVVGISGFIQPNTMVDIVVLIEPSDSSGQKELISKIVLQNIKVLASGKKIETIKNGTPTASVNTMTLQVTPEQAEKLALASSEGKLQVVVRSSLN